MTTSDIIQIIRETSLYLKLPLNEGKLQSVYFNQREYEVGDIPEFKRDLIEAGRKCNLLILDQNIAASQLEFLVRESKDPLIIFVADGNNLKPEVLVRDRSDVRYFFHSR